MDAREFDNGVELTPLRGYVSEPNVGVDIEPVPDVDDAAVRFLRGSALHLDSCLARAGEYLVVEDGILSGWGSLMTGHYGDGPNRATREIPERTDPPFAVTRTFATSTAGM